MKLQDVLFIVLMVGLLVFSWRRPKWMVGVGLFCLALSIPLFYFWIFFTAQRLVYYSAGFILIGIIIMIFQMRKEE